MSKWIYLMIPIFTVIIIENASQMIGKGKWLVVNIKKCPEDASYLYTFDISRHKLNRSHIVFSGWLEITEPLDETLATRIDVCKQVDGGCKPYHVITDESFCHFLDKYAKENMEKWYRMAGYEPPICPLAKGRYEVDNYLFNYNELPDDGIYGEYTATAYVLKEGVEVACVEIVVVYEIEHDDE